MGTMIEDQGGEEQWRSDGVMGYTRKKKRHGRTELSSNQIKVSVTLGKKNRCAIETPLSVKAAAAIPTVRVVSLNTPFDPKRFKFLKFFADSH